jgi:hypothetical protein
MEEITVTEMGVPMKEPWGEYAESRKQFEAFVSTHFNAPRWPVWVASRIALIDALCEALKGWRERAEKAESETRQLREALQECVSEMKAASVSRSISVKERQ